MVEFCVIINNHWPAYQKSGTLHLVRGLMWYLLNRFCKQYYTVCINSFSLVEWRLSVTMHTMYPGLESFVKRKHLAAQISHFYTEIISYPVTFS